MELEVADEDQTLLSGKKEQMYPEAFFNVEI